MENDKRNIFPNTVRGFKKTFLNQKDLIFQPKKIIDEKNSNTHNKLSEFSENKVPNFLVSHKILFQPHRFYEEAKFSSKSFGSVISYGVNTNQGSIRNYNEDRVSIILNVIKPPSRKNEDWPKVSFFGIFDGHGGAQCSEFLKENLHHYV